MHHSNDSGSPPTAGHCSCIFCTPAIHGGRGDDELLDVAAGLFAPYGAPTNTVH